MVLEEFISINSKTDENTNKVFWEIKNLMSFQSSFHNFSKMWSANSMHYVEIMTWVCNITKQNLGVQQVQSKERYVTP